MAAALAGGAIVVAVLLWPASPIDLGDDWIADAACVPVAGGVRFTAELRVPGDAESADLVNDLSHLVVEVAAHEGGRHVATTKTSYPVRTSADRAPVQLVSSDALAAPLAVVDIEIDAGAIKLPTCSATVVGHR